MTGHIIFGGTTQNCERRDIYAVPHPPLPVCCLGGTHVLQGFTEPVWITAETGKMYWRLELFGYCVVSLSHERFTSPDKRPGWWQLGFGVTFEVRSSIHSPRGTLQLRVVDPSGHPSPYADPAWSWRPPSPHLWLKRTSPIFKVNTAQKDPCLVPANNKKKMFISLSYEIIMYSIEKQCLKRHQKVPSTKA